MSVHQDIRTWIVGLPLWQQDALRRLDERQSLTDDDIAELVVLAKAENGIPPASGTQVVARPIAFPEASEVAGAGAVTLSQLKDLQNINALAEGQPVHFPAAGVTVIFGDNGSGKSGFGRLLRTVCWARQRPGAILGNVDTQDQRTQEATVCYRIGDADQAPFLWKSGVKPPQELGNIAVYDADCGVVYVNEEQQSAYVPFGLDYFPRLAIVCDRVRQKLKAEHDASAATLSIWPDVGAATEIGKQLAALPAASAKKRIDDTQALTDEEQVRCDQLTKMLEELRRDDPRKRVLTLQNDARALRAHKLRLKTTQDALTDEKATELKSALTTASTKAEAAKLASDKALGKEVLPGTGGAVWEELWNAARKFSEVAYPGVAYPACEHGERCVLCQQPLKPEAVARLKAFDDFVKDEAATQAQVAAALVLKVKRAFETLECVRADQQSTFDDLDLRESGLGAGIKSWCEAAETRRKALATAADGFVLTNVPALADSPGDRLEALAKVLDDQAEAIEKAIDDETRMANEREVAELSARRWVCEHRADIAAELAKLRTHDALGKLLGGPTSTNKITNTGNALTETHVTVAHKDRFHAELEALRASHLGVELVKRGVKGKTLHQLLLTRGKGHSIASVLSTGERNIVGLAAFFAELQPDTGHGIILDDPVSSLDQDRRDDVARRIAVECKKRQVVVWTHDLSFVGALYEAAEQIEGAAVSVVTIANLNGTAGIVDEYLPWPLMKIKDRLKRLASDVDELRKLSDAKKAKEYTDAGRLFYGHLRDSWERAVEEVLFNEVIQRWRRSVQPQRIERIADKVTRADFETINEAMSRCSRYVHDQQNQTPPPVPTIDQLEADLKRLREWVAGKR